MATRSELVRSVVHDREAELGHHHKDRDPVSVHLVCAPAVRACFRKLSSWWLPERFSHLSWSVHHPVSTASCFIAVLSAAAALCQATTVKLRRAANGPSAERRGWTVRAGANFLPHRGQCPALRIRVLRRSGTAYHAGFESSDAVLALGYPSH